MSKPLQVISQIPRYNPEWQTYPPITRHDFINLSDIVNDISGGDYIATENPTNYTLIIRPNTLSWEQFSYIYNSLF